MIRYIGRGDRKRYFLVNRKRRFWTGDGWTRNLRKAMRFASLRDVHDEYQRLLARLFEDVPVREFEAVIRVRVYTNRPFDLETLRDYLNRWARVGVDCENTNDGPQDDCLILQRADYSALKEVKPGPSFLADPESSPTRPDSS
jgi:hypothetical protein